MLIIKLARQLTRTENFVPIGICVKYKKHIKGVGMKE